MVDVSTLDDATLANNIKNEVNIDESLDELINRHSGIFFKAGSNCLGAGQLRNDFFDEKEFFFYSVASKFDNSRGCTFPVYLYNMTRWSCMKELTKATKRRKEDPYDPFDLDSVMRESNVAKSPVDDIMFNEDLSLVKDALDKIGDEKATKIIRMRYLEGEGKKPTSFFNLKDEVGLSRWGVIIAHNRGIKRVQQHIAK